MPSPLACFYKWPKHMGLKRAAIGKSFGEHLGNLMGTHWELEKNIKGTKSEKSQQKGPQHYIKRPQQHCVFLVVKGPQASGIATVMPGSYV